MTAHGHTPLGALQATFSPSSPPRTRPGSILIVGATGVLGNAVTHQLIGAARQGRVQVLTREPLRAGLRSLEAWQVDDDEPSRWPPAPSSAAPSSVAPSSLSSPDLAPPDHAARSPAPEAPDQAIVMFEPPRSRSGRERALWTPRPEQLPALAAWLHRVGVRSLLVVQPHDTGRLPDALRHGLANLDEQAVAALDFERLLFVRSARASEPAVADSLPQRLAHWMLGIFKYMVPESERPLRAPVLARLVQVLMDVAPPGAHVVPTPLLWRAAQGDAPVVLREALDIRRGPGDVRVADDAARAVQAQSPT